MKLLKVSSSEMIYSLAANIWICPLLIVMLGKGSIK